MKTQVTISSDELDQLYQFRRAVDSCALSAEIDVDGCFIAINDKFLRLLGLDEIKCLGMELSSLLDPTFPSHLLLGARETLLRGLPWQGEINHRSRSGRSFWIDASFSPLVSPTGSVTSIQIIAFEVSERKSLESALAASNRFQKTLLETAPVGILLANEMGECTYVNQEWSKLTGSRLTNAIGNGWLNAVHTEDRARVMREWSNLVASGERFVSEFRYVNRNLEEKWVLVTSSRIASADDQKHSFLRVEKDLSEIKARIASEEAMRVKLTAASKLSALGEMAAGIAHEINNPLAIIQARALISMGAIEKEKLAPEMLKKSFSSIVSNCNRISEIIRSMKLLSRDSAQNNFDEVGLKTLFDDVLVLCNSRFVQTSVNLIVTAIPANILVRCQQGQLCQVLLNLLNNAFDAAAESPYRWIKVDFLDLEEEIAISVSDSGSGIPAENREAIFQAFFTTKPPGAGTGLGLSISQSIVKAHGGSLSLDTGSPNTCFVVRLPKVVNQSLKFA